VERYEQTLQIDSEDLDAHFGLSQCFARLGEGMPAVPPDANAMPATPQELLTLSKVFADRKQADKDRLCAVARLCDGIPAYGEQPTDPEQPKLPVLQALIGRCREVYGQAGDKDLQAAAARALGLLYRQTHLIYRPDDNAKDLTMRLYRQKHPAADRASQAIVIYPTTAPERPASE
jgi:hypothetical protein